MKTADVVQTQGEAGGLRQPLTPPSNYLVLPTTKGKENNNFYVDLLIIFKV